MQRVAGKPWTNDHDASVEFLVQLVDAAIEGLEKLDCGHEVILVRSGRQPPLLWFLGKEFVLLAWASRPYPFRSAFGVSHAAPRNTTKRNNCGAASDTLSSAPFQTGRPGSR